MFDKLRQAHLHAPDWQQESLTFVPLRGTWFAQSEHSFDLEEETAKFLSSDKKVLLLLGDSGSGKSLYTQGLASKLWQDHKSDSAIPVWISLPSLKNPVNRAIEETFEKFGFNSEEIENLRLTKSFLFIFDAFDEIHQLKNLWVSNHLGQWKAKIIITCRREYLYHVDNYKLYFTPFNGEKAVYQDYDEMIIKPFSEEQIEQYIKQYIQHQKLEWSLEQYQKSLEEIPGLKNLIKTPFLLKLAMEALPKMPQEKEQKYMTQAKLYDVFIEQWFIRQEQKLKLAKKIKEDEDIKPEFWDYAKRLAQLMHQQKVTQITYDSSQSSDLFGEVEDNPWQKFFNADNPKVELLRTACLVREAGQHQYTFIHNSLLEYFLTRDLYENLLSEQPEIKIKKETSKVSQLELKKQDYFNERLLVEEDNTLQFLADRVDEDELFKKSLFDGIYASRKNPQVSISASNAITILNRASVSFSNLDFSEIQIPEANLDGAILDSTNLSKANLHKVKTPNAWLHAANLSGANLTNIDFSEKPFLDIAYKINSTFYSPKENLIAVYQKKRNKLHRITIYDLAHNKLIRSLDVKDERRNISFAFNFQKKLFASFVDSDKNENKVIRVWNEETGECFKTLNSDPTYTDVITSVAFSPTDNYLVSASKNLIVIWDINSTQFSKKLNVNFEKVWNVVFYLSGDLIAIYGHSQKNFEFIVWNVKTEEYKHVLEYSLDSAYNTVTAFDTLGKYFATSNKNLVSIKNLISGESTAELSGHTHKISALQFNSLGTRIVSSSDKDETVRVWDVIGGVCLNIFPLNHCYITSLAFTENNKSLIVSASPSNDLNNFVRSYEVPDLQYTRADINHMGKIDSLAVNVFTEKLATLSKDGTVRLWSLKSAEQLIMIDLKESSLINAWNSRMTIDSSIQIGVVYISQSGKKVAFRFEDSICIFDIEKRNFSNVKKLNTIYVPFSQSPNPKLSSFKLHPDNKRLFLPCGNKILCYDLESDIYVKPLEDSDSTQKFEWIVISPDGTKLLTMSEATSSVSKRQAKKEYGTITIKLWDLSDYCCLFTKNIQTYSSVREGSFSFTGSKILILISGNEKEKTNGVIQIINANTGEVTCIIESEGVAHACFDVSEKFIFAWYQGVFNPFSNLIKIFDVQTKKVVSTMKLPDLITDLVCYQENSTSVLIIAFGASIACFSVEIIQEKFKFYMRWLRKAEKQFLFCNELNITNVIGLNAGNKRLLNQHGAIDSEQIDFFAAIKAKDIITLKNLVQKNSELVLIRDPDNWTGLLTAAYYGHKKIVEFLLDNGSLIEESYSLPWGFTAIHFAVIEGHMEVVHLLLDKGANIEAETYKEETPLDLALSRNNESIVQLLLEKGANFQTRRKDNMSAVDIVVKNDNELVFNIMLTTSKNKEILINLIPLNRLKSSPRIREILLDNGLSVTARDTDGKTLLHYAVKNTNEDLLLLLQKCDDLNIQDNDGNTPLCIAVKEDNESAAKILLEHKADPNIQANQGSPLHIAAAEGHENIVKLLLQYKANVHAKEPKTENTPLHAVIGFKASSTGLKRFEDYEEIVKALLENGADIDAVNKIGHTPRQIAVNNNDKIDKKLVELLDEWRLKITQNSSAANQPLIQSTLQASFFGKAESEDTSNVANISINLSNEPKTFTF
jgi:ankyrin repeat protein/WD40 repeat protein